MLLGRCFKRVEKGLSVSNVLNGRFEGVTKVFHMYIMGFLLLIFWMFETVLEVNQPVSMVFQR